MSRQTAVVKWFDSERGIGFLIGTDDQDIFVHYSDIEGTGWRSLKQGQQVEFLPVTTDRGPAAKEVTALP